MIFCIYRWRPDCQRQHVVTYARKRVTRLTRIACDANELISLAEIAIVSSNTHIWWPYAEFKSRFGFWRMPITMNNSSSCSHFYTVSIWIWWGNPGSRAWNDNNSLLTQIEKTLQSSFVHLSWLQFHEHKHTTGSVGTLQGAKTSKIISGIDRPPLTTGAFTFAQHL